MQTISMWSITNLCSFATQNSSFYKTNLLLMQRRRAFLGIQNSSLIPIYNRFQKYDAFSSKERCSIQRRQNMRQFGLQEHEECAKALKNIMMTLFNTCLVYLQILRKHLKLLNHPWLCPSPYVKITPLFPQFPSSFSKFSVSQTIPNVCLLSPSLNFISFYNSQRDYNFPIGSCDIEGE